MQIKQAQKIADEWCKKHGCAKIDVKSRDIWLTDGGLFAVEPYKAMLPKFLRFKKLPNGMSRCIFSKKETPHTLYKIDLWVEELDETIAYFKSMQRMLRKIDLKTGHRLSGKTLEAFLGEIKGQPEGQGEDRNKGRA
jgi:hypothetical protein